MNVTLDIVMTVLGVAEKFLAIYVLYIKVRNACCSKRS